MACAWMRWAASAMLRMRSTRGALSWAMASRKSSSQRTRMCSACRATVSARSVRRCASTGRPAIAQPPSPERAVDLLLALLAADVVADEDGQRGGPDNHHQRAERLVLLALKGPEGEGAADGGHAERVALLGLQRRLVQQEMLSGGGQCRDSGGLQDRCHRFWLSCYARHIPLLTNLEKSPAGRPAVAAPTVPTEARCSLQSQAPAVLCLLSSP